MVCRTTVSTSHELSDGGLTKRYMRPNRCLLSTQSEHPVSRAASIARSPPSSLQRISQLLYRASLVCMLAGA